MNCVRCGAENIDSADYCIACKSPLRFRRRSERYQKRKIVITTVVVLGWIFCFAFFFRETLFPDGFFSAISMSEKNKDAVNIDLAREKLFAQLEAVNSREKVPEEETVTVSEEKKVEAKSEPSAAKVDEDELEVISGTLTILDPWNRELANIRTALSSEGWMALPARTCFGGTTWTFNSDFGDKAAVLGGRWQEGRPVGIWQVAHYLGPEKSVGLAVWDGSVPLNWLSLESEMAENAVALSSFQNQGDFTVAPLPAQIREAGIFVQGVNIVGWTFGRWISGAYLWNPIDNDGAIEQNVSVRDFYNITFANGREERFSLALAAHDETDIIKRIGLFLDGYKVQPRLAASDTPYYLLPDETVKELRLLTQQAISSGYEKQVVTLFDSHILKLIGDINLFIDIVGPISRVSGYASAISAIEQVGSYIVQRLGVNVPELNEIHLSLYQDWFQTHIRNSAFEEADSVYLMARSYYANDPYIHLLAVELALLKGDWVEAERLLYQRNYPPELLDKYELLSRQISDLKGQEGSIVVRFAPGSNRIPLTATLNGSRRQDFLVDTGASMVTIPSSAVAELGLEIVSGGHYDQRMVSTAGGVRMASEVVIDSIEVGGWVEYEVKALVMDIPEQPGLGLLGLNYLGRFSMDLRNEEGVLTLTPR